MARAEKKRARDIALAKGKAGGSNDDDEQESQPVFPAIQLLHDPQGLAERLFRRARQQDRAERFELRLLVLNFVSRLVGAHKLLLLPLYSHLQRYLTPSQRDVTKFLACLLQVRLGKLGGGGGGV